MGGESQGPAGGDRARAPRFWGWAAPTPRALFSAGWVLLPLRAFLGGTFLFAGLQKLANPAFFKASNPVSIQAQLAGAVRRSPVHALLSPLTHVAVWVGLVIALAEVAVGLGALVGLWTRVAAAGGVVLSVLLFLTVSYHSSPYYTGADIVFAFAWTPLVLAGAGGVLSADALVVNRARDRMGARRDTVVPVAFSVVRRSCGVYVDGGCRVRGGAACEPAPCPFLAVRAPASPRLDVRELDRRTVASMGVASAGAALLGLLASSGAAEAGRLAGGTKAVTDTPVLGGTRSLPAGGSGGTTPAPGSPGGSVPAGTAIGASSVVPVGGAASFTDPKTGDPSLVVQPRAGEFVAFDAVCPHAGCTVAYHAGQGLFVCPCHGSEFSGTTGALRLGPATTGLTRIDVAEGPDGQLYVT